jgi:hypothetical protein
MATLKPWREIAIPHEDVLKGTFKQAEFAADISRVHDGTATPEYQNPSLFFERTFITEGMRCCWTRWSSGSLAVAVTRSFSCRPPSVAARRTPCWPSITWPAAKAGQAICLAFPDPRHARASPSCRVARIAVLDGIRFAQPAR